MAGQLTRRAVLGGLAAGMAGSAVAKAPATSLRPMQRPDLVARATGVDATMPAAAPQTAEAADLIAAARLGGDVAYVVADAKTGLVLEARDADRPMPPASTAKSITSLYALDHLGTEYRFETKLLATGPVAGGMVQGDLILAGGGDPTLTTDDLGDLAQALKASGVRGVTGAFRVWGGALPFIDAIDPDQPSYFGYNPSVSGLNLNFNRVNFEWKRQKDGFALAMDARGTRFVPPVTTATVKVVDRALPIFTYDGSGEQESWTVASSALGRGGSRWLPVRRPEAYAGEVFRTLAAADGVMLPVAQVMDTALPAGATVISTHKSAPLKDVLREMLKYSTNMTAEVVGMTASLQLGIRDRNGSCQAMSDWLKAHVPGTGARFVDHSGLEPASRISASDMVQALRELGPAEGLRGLLKPLRVSLTEQPPVRTRKGKKARRAQVGPEVLADVKTGTLNFVSALVGYFTVPDGSDLVFAIFTADTARRDALSMNERERPPGGEAWVGRSRQLQQALIRRWAKVYGA